MVFSGFFVPIQLPSRDNVLSLHAGMPSSKQVDPRAVDSNRPRQFEV